jgi:hypothetical protein
METSYISVRTHNVMLSNCSGIFQKKAFNKLRMLNFLMFYEIIKMRLLRI